MFEYAEEVMPAASSLADRAVAWPDTADWYALRSSGIGSSEIGAVVGCDEFCTAREIYERKLGSLEEFEGNKATRFGKHNEPFVLSEFCREEGEEVAVYPCPMIRHPEHPFMFGTPDADLRSGRLYEGKVANFRQLSKWGPQGTDEIPERYLCQTQWQLAVAGRDECKLAVMIAGDELRVYTIERNDRLIERLTEAAYEFWRRVVHRDPPPFDTAHRSTRDLLRGLYGTIADDQVVALSSGSVAAWATYEELGKEIKELEAQQAEARAIVEAEIGNHLGGDLGNGKFIKKSVSERASYVVKAATVVTYRACNVKGKA